MVMDLDSEISRDGDAGWSGFRSRPDALTLPEGVASYAQNMRFVRGRAEVRKGAKRLAQDVNAGSVPLTLPFVLGDVLALLAGLVLDFDLESPVSVTSLVRLSTTVTATVTAHGLSTGDTVNIAGATEPEYNGDFSVTVTGVNAFTYEVVGFPASPAGGTISMIVGPLLGAGITRVGTTVTVVTATAHGLATGQQVAIEGATQTEYNGDFSVTVTGVNAFTFQVSGTPTTPATGTIVVTWGPGVRNSYSGGIFAAGVFSSPKSSVTLHGREYVVLVGSDSAYLWREGETLVTRPFPSGQIVEVDDEVTVIQAFDRLFVLRARDLLGEWAPQVAVTLTRAGTTATATFTLAHGFTTSDRVAVEGAEQAGWLAEFDVATVADANTITFVVGNEPATPATGSVTVRKVRPPMVWNGEGSEFTVVAGGSHPLGASYSKLRSTGIAAYFNNQLVFVPTPAQDTVLVSDVLEYETYDPILKTWRANAGSADRIMALHPFAERDVLVFMRNSIYRAHVTTTLDGTAMSTTDSFIELLTTEVGCRARRSVVTAGPYIYFLADQGVYRMDLNYSDYKVRGMQVPLSDGITDLLDDVNDVAMHRSSAAWFDNRYWLAVPVGDSELPNCILVWSALTNEWESKDIYPTGISHLLVSDYGGKRRLFAASLSGTLFVLDEMDRGDDSNNGSEVVPIDAELMTRAYWLKDMGPKRWLRSTVNVRLEGASAVGLDAVLAEPDVVASLAGLENEGAEMEDYAWKMPIRRPGHNLKLRFRNSVPGRWTLRNCAVEVATARPSMRGRTVA